MTTTVYISDFSDFHCLQEACNYYSGSIIDKSNTRFTFDNVNPFEKLRYFNGYYNESLLMAKENGFDVVRLKFLLDTLKSTGLEMINIMSAKMCYPESHINRQL